MDLPEHLINASYNFSSGPSEADKPVMPIYAFIANAHSPLWALIHGTSSNATSFLHVLCKIKISTRTDRSTTSLVQFITKKTAWCTQSDMLSFKPTTHKSKLVLLRVAEPSLVACACFITFPYDTLYVVSRYL
jgi:hypothetical protein